MSAAGARTYRVRRAAHRVVLALTLLFVLVAVSVSTGLLVHTAWVRDLENGLFALSFAVLSARAALSWVLWSRQSLDPSDGYQRYEARKSVDDEAVR